MHLDVVKCSILLCRTAGELVMLTLSFMPMVIKSFEAGWLLRFSRTTLIVKFQITSHCVETPVEDTAAWFGVTLSSAVGKSAIWLAALAFSVWFPGICALNFVVFVEPVVIELQAGVEFSTVIGIFVHKTAVAIVGHEVLEVALLGITVVNEAFALWDELAGAVTPSEGVCILNTGCIEGIIMPALKDVVGSKISTFVFLARP